MQLNTSNLVSPNSKLGYGDYVRFRDLVLERSGLHFPEKKRTDLEAGIFKALAGSPLVHHNGHYDFDHYYTLLQDKGNPLGQTEMERLINALTIGETHFFRNQAQFNALANQVLPQLIKQKQAAANAVGPQVKPQLRIWSAGCASGQEPYSIAILLKELLPDIDNWHILILATDVNKESLAMAQNAIYSDWSFREDRAKELRQKYFTQQPVPSRHSTTPQYQLHPEIAQMVTFSSLNLIEDNYPAIHNNTVSMDLILCRNVTIYFTEKVTKSVVTRFHQALVDGGWLVVGHSEPSLTAYSNFETHTFTDTLFYRKGSQPWPNVWEWLNPTTDNVAAPTQPVEIESYFAPIIPENEVALPSPNGDTPPVQPSKTELYQAAELLLNQGRTEEALAKLHHLHTIDPAFALAQNLLGKSYANLGQWEEARYWCQNALKLDSLLAESYYILSLINDHEEHVDEAIDLAKKAVYLERNSPLYHFSLAMIYKGAGQTESAKRACRNTIKILEKQIPTDVVPDTGGTTVRHLLEATQRTLAELEQ